MELDVNGKKNAYTWNGEMNRTLTGYDLRADASVNGRKLHMNLRNKSPEGLKVGIRKYFQSIVKKGQKMRKLAKTKKHLKRKRR